MAETDVASAALGQLLQQQAAKQRNEEDTIPLNIDEALQDAATLRGKVVVVTGAGSGFGREYSVLAASYGCVQRSHLPFERSSERGTLVGSCCADLLARLLRRVELSSS
jgi:hypothetical protein